ncbi:EpsG family protein [Epilithonimonas mollis]|uniref:EpsG family protein n=1 Tax=Epilithonimonas mollis TaxID=216903 RepID=A0A1M6RGG2_9FLAO|nr:EpsG family protein [Epilithonimonas mollis]SHK31542.1 EpsG family protein [Epilithonimonas mollis]
MEFLHPVFTIVFVFLILYSFVEVNRGDDSRTPKFIFWSIAVYLIVIVGYRKYVGPDYPVYEAMYNEYFPTVDYRQLIDKMFFQRSRIDIEWMYAMLNKWVYTTGLPFKELTLIIAVISICGKLAVYYKNSKYPVFSILLFMIPGFFIGDSGHMRQALGMTVCILSFRFIKERKVWWYLLCIYVAYAFHKSTIVFLPAYWLAIIPMSSGRIFYSVMVCVILSPFQIYNAFSSFLSTLSLQDLSNGYNGYINYESSASSFMDGLMLVFSFLLITYDKVACQKIYYYEYMRNILITGVCLYFIMRSNPVFSTRLVGSYLGFVPLVIPNIVNAIDNKNTKRLVHLFFVIFMIFYYFVFAKYQGNAGRFTPDRYQNFLWSN